MATEPSSPKRRHILSSFNTEDGIAPSTGPTPDDFNNQTDSPLPKPREEEQPPEPTAEPSSKRTSKFRFKSTHSSSHRSSRRRERDSDDRDGATHRDRARDRSRSRDHSQGRDPSRRHHRHRHHHRHKRRRERTRSPTPPNPHEPPPLDAEAAFRESLFDAMADDEGAAYWEGVYGQPIHVYSHERAGPDGELERMDDDEYATFVRRKMWEKTHQGLLEERARREQRRREKEIHNEEAARLTQEMERSLRKGEERKRKRGWKEYWDKYVQAWDSWDGSLDTICWPVRSARRDDVDAAAVREFYVLGIDPTEVGEVEFLTKLKDERVRWHPDKIQQRLGGKVDGAVMKDVTAVFQIIDRLWSDTRSRAKS
ncbi:hypothetical protein F5Y18DRAFT_427312 [Xylariaceae sp. FL1019]|nr:hypothetical protein F5Y18DRAFT_427312 [Xylariaceae sp. FL1019]